LNSFHFSRFLFVLFVGLSLVASARAQQSAPPDAPCINAAASRKSSDAKPLTPAILVRLENSFIVRGEPVELVVVVDARRSYREQWPDFLGGQAHLKVRIVDGAGEASRFFWLDQGNLYGAFRSQYVKEPIPVVRATQFQKDYTIETHLWLGTEQLPLNGAGNYKIVVVSSPEANPTPPWYGPNGKRTPRNVYVGLPEPLLTKETNPIEKGEADTKEIEAPNAPTVALPLSVKEDGTELKRIADALLAKIMYGGPSGVSRHEAEIKALFSLSGPEALSAQDALMDAAGDDPRTVGAIYGVLIRTGGPRSIAFIEDQHWNKGRRGGINELELMHYFGKPEARQQIEEIFRKRGEPLRMPIWCW